MFVWLGEVSRVEKVEDGETLLKPPKGRLPEPLKMGLISCSIQIE